MKTGKYTVIAGIASALLVLSLLVGCVNIFAFNNDFYKDEYAKLGAAEYVGVSEENLNEELDDLIVLTDENGEDINFEFVDLIEYKGKEYVVLLPELEDNEEDEGEVVILEVQDGDTEDEENYVSVEDEKTLAEVFEIFKEKFKDEFEFED